VGRRGGRRRGTRLLPVVMTAVLISGGLSGCRPVEPGRRIAFFLPEAKTTRYEMKDRPYFVERVRELCATCRVRYANAGQEPARQLSQVEAALANDVDVVVIDPVDARAARAAIMRAEEAGVPVVAYDRLIDDPRVDWYVSFDNVAVGRLQAASLAEAVAGRPGGVVALHGAPSDPNAAEYRRGATEEFSRRGVRLVTEKAVEDWNPDRARREMERALARYGARGISGVYVANDAMAAMVVDALEEAGVVPLPPVTGQDAELGALRRILSGRQAMTVYKPLRLEAGRAAEVAVALAAGRRSTRCGSARPGSGVWCWSRCLSARPACPGSSRPTGSGRCARSAPAWSACAGRWGCRCSAPPCPPFPTERRRPGGGPVPGASVWWRCRSVPA
jgi:D-xylose transport system substrate-binding protein